MPEDMEIPLTTAQRWENDGLFKTQKLPYLIKSVGQVVHKTSSKLLVVSLTAYMWNNNVCSCMVFVEKPIAPIRTLWCFWHMRCYRYIYNIHTVRTKSHIIEVFALIYSLNIYSRFSGWVFDPKKQFDPAENDKLRKELWAAPRDPRFPQQNKTKLVVDLRWEIIRSSIG